MTYIRSRGSVELETLIDADGLLDTSTATCRCMVLGCGREGVFLASRRRRTPQGDVAVLLRYCAEHYGEANRFHAGRR